MRHVILICGPPCAGKTTLARQLATEDTEIVDFDDIAVSLGSPVRHQHPTHIIGVADAETRARIDRIAGDDTAKAVVIRTLPKGHEREALARRLRADQTILCLPTKQECTRRAAARPSGTRRAVGLWYWQYTPSPADSIR